jgi:hypothetical protein
MRLSSAGGVSLVTSMRAITNEERSKSCQATTRRANSHQLPDIPRQQTLFDVP